MAGNEHVRARIMQSRQTVELSAAECWPLLACVSLGRIVFTRHAMPAIRPVNHLVDDETIVIRSHLGAAIVARAAAEDGAVVCYEADNLDPVGHTGWSVFATGMARLVRDPAAIARYEQMLEPWVDSDMDYVIAIKPQVVTGLRLVSRSADLSAPLLAVAAGAMQWPRRAALRLPGDHITPGRAVARLQAQAAQAFTAELSAGWVHQCVRSAPGCTYKLG